MTMCPLPIEGADAAFYFRLFTTSWYAGDDRLALDLARFRQTYRIPSPVFEQLRGKVDATWKPSVTDAPRASGPPSGRLLAGPPLDA